MIPILRHILSAIFQCMLEWSIKVFSKFELHAGLGVTEENWATQFDVRGLENFFATLFLVLGIEKVRRTDNHVREDTFRTICLPKFKCPGPEIVTNCLKPFSLDGTKSDEGLEGSFRLGLLVLKSFKFYLFERKKNVEEVELINCYPNKFRCFEPGGEVVRKVALLRCSHYIFVGTSFPSFKICKGFFGDYSVSTPKHNCQPKDVNISLMEKGVVF